MQVFVRFVIAAIGVFCLVHAWLVATLKVKTAVFAHRKVAVTPENKRGYALLYGALGVMWIAVAIFA